MLVRVIWVSKGALDPETISRLPKLADDLARAGDASTEIAGHQSDVLVHHELTSDGQRRLCRVRMEIRNKIWFWSSTGVYTKIMYWKSVIDYLVNEIFIITRFLACTA